MVVTAETRKSHTRNCFLVLAKVTLAILCTLEVPTGKVSDDRLVGEEADASSSRGLVAAGCGKAASLADLVWPCVCWSKVTCGGSKFSSRSGGVAKDSKSERSSLGGTASGSKPLKSSPSKFSTSCKSAGASGSVDCCCCSSKFEGSTAVASSDRLA